MKKLPIIIALLAAMQLPAQYLEVSPNGLVNLSSDASYIVLEAPGTSADDLYLQVLSALKASYAYPDRAISEIPGKQITVSSVAYDRITDPPVDIYYTWIIRFKDGKVRIDLPDLRMERIGGKLLLYHMQKRSMFGEYGIYTKDKLRFPQAKAEVEDFLNTYIERINHAITTDDDW